MSDVPELTNPTFLISWFCSVNNIRFLDIKKIGNHRCCYCLEKPSVVGQLRKFNKNRIRLFRCKACSWKLGVIPPTSYNKQNVLDIKLFGIWNNPDNFIKHEHEMIQKYNLAEKQEAINNDDNKTND